jgi:hypothetical protein
MNAALDGRPGIVKIQSHGGYHIMSTPSNKTDKLVESRRSLLGGESLDRNYTPYKGGYHDRQGLTTTATAAPRKSMVYIPNSLWTWSFLGVSLIQAGIALGLEGYVAKMQLVNH